MNRLAQTHFTHYRRIQLVILQSSYHHSGEYFLSLQYHKQICPLSPLLLLTRIVLSQKRKPFIQRVPLPPLSHSQTSLLLCKSISNSLFLSHAILTPTPNRRFHFTQQLLLSFIIITLSILTDISHVMLPSISSRLFSHFIVIAEINPNTSYTNNHNQY